MKKSDQTKQYIIEKAAPIFNKYGYEGTSMSQLTQAIGMTKGAIYGNFKDKHEIAIAAFDFNFSKISKKIEAAVRSKPDACEKLIAFANFHLDYFAELSKTGGCPVLNAAIDSDNAHPVLKKHVAQSLEIWMGNISKIISSGIKNNQINKQIKPEQTASVFVSLIEGGIMLSKVTGNTIYLSRNIDHIIHMIETELRV